MTPVVKAGAFVRECPEFQSCELHFSSCGVRVCSCRYSCYVQIVRKRHKSVLNVNYMLTHSSEGFVSVLSLKHITP